MRSPSANAGVGLVGIAIKSTRLERDLVVAADERAHLLGLQVVRVVVARAEHVGAEQDPALDLGPEPGVARAIVHVAERRRIGRAIAIPHPVVAREVGARLGRRDEVVDRDGVRAVGQRDVDDLGALLV